MRPHLQSQSAGFGKDNRIGKAYTKEKEEETGDGSLKKKIMGFAFQFIL